MPTRPVRTVSTAERRARLGVRHLLAVEQRAGDPSAVADAMVALHATDPVSVFLGVVARSVGEAEVLAHTSRALYEDRALVRVLAMRRTMFVVRRELYPVLDAACTRDIAAKERAKLVGWIANMGVTGDAAAWLAALEDEVLAAVEALGAATTAQLSERVAGLRERYDPTPGKSYSRAAPIATQVLFGLAAQARLVRGQPRGSWTSTLNEWSALERWLGEPLAAVELDAARSELVRRYLYAFGPAPLADLKWWTGWTLAQVKRALGGLDTVEVALDDGASALLLADDLEVVAAPAPWAALLPALDPTPMGWQARAWFLGEHGPQLFDKNGNVGPTLWWDGRIVGGWAQRPSGELEVELLEDVCGEAHEAIEAEVRRLSQTLGETVVTPRFRTPLERRLAT